MRFQVASRVRSAALRRKCFSLAKTGSSDKSGGGTILKPEIRVECEAGISTSVRIETPAPGQIRELGLNKSALALLLTVAAATAAAHAGTCRSSADGVTALRHAGTAASSCGTKTNENQSHRRMHTNMKPAMRATMMAMVKIPIVCVSTYFSRKRNHRANTRWLARINQAC
jgi:hypothetical protein